MSGSVAFSRKPDPIDPAINAINEAASYCRTLWVAFIGYVGTLFVLMSGTTHQDLLLENPVKLPLFNVENGIPLRLFYVVAPLLLVLFHLNLLLKLRDLSFRIWAFTGRLDGNSNAATTIERNRLRRKLIAFDYAVLDCGLVEDWRERWLLRSVSSATVFIIPVVLLLFAQLQFLPFHDQGISWIHRALLSTDLALIGVIQFWLGKPTYATNPGVGWNAIRKLRRGVFFGIPFFISAFVLAFPDEPTDVFWPTFWRLNHSETEFFPYSARAGADYAESFFVRRSLYLADPALWTKAPDDDLASILTDVTIIQALRYQGLEVDSKIARVVQRVRTAGLSLRGRNLAYANFENANLFAADFGPNLNNEQMLRGIPKPQDRTDLTGANFSRADMRLARLSWVKAANADFFHANLQHANLQDAELQGATLITQLQGADLSRANLEGADFGPDPVAFSTAQLQGAILSSTHLQSTYLSKADLHGANLLFADLAAADLAGANLQGVDLTGADLEGTDLSMALLNGADLQRARLRGAEGSNATISSAYISAPDLDQDYDFSLLRGEFTSRYQGLQQSNLLNNISRAEQSIASASMPFQEARGDNVWIEDIKLANPNIQLADPQVPDAFALKWAQTVAADVCAGAPQNGASVEIAAITANLVDRVRFLLTGASQMNATRARALARALVDSPCIEVYLSAKIKGDLQKEALSGSPTAVPVPAPGANAAR